MPPWAPPAKERRQSLCFFRQKVWVTSTKFRVFVWNHGSILKYHVHMHMFTCILCTCIYARAYAQIFCAYAQNFVHMHIDLCMCICTKLCDALKFYRFRKPAIWIKFLDILSSLFIQHQKVRTQDLDMFLK